MQVYFSLHLLDATQNPITVSEAQLNADFAAIQPLLPESHRLEGLLVFEGSGMPVLEIHDALWQSILRLCFTFVVQTLRNKIKVFLYAYFISGDFFVFIPTHGNIRAMMSEMPMVIYQKNEILLALCCFLIMELILCNDYQKIATAIGLSTKWNQRVPKLDKHWKSILGLYKD